jgi:hypothetical protein
VTGKFIIFSVYILKSASGILKSIIEIGSKIGAKLLTTNDFGEAAPE